jgi:hypothetical protein
LGSSGDEEHSSAAELSLSMISRSKKTDRKVNMMHAMSTVVNWVTAMLQTPVVPL